MAQNDWIAGIHAVEAFLERNAERIKQVWVQQGWEKNQRLAKLLMLIKKQGLRPQVSDRKVLDARCEGFRHQGIVIEVQAGRTLDESDLLRDFEALQHAAFYLVLDTVQDPHNLGACLRSANACGCDGLIIPADKSVSVNATVRKVASGAAEYTPVYVVKNLARALEMIKDKGVWITGTAADTDETLYDIDFKGHSAIVIGAEGTGLRRLTKEHCDYLVKIPMVGQVESLNASVAAGVMMYEVLRQRR